MNLKYFAIGDIYHLQIINGENKHIKKTSGGGDAPSLQKKGKSGRSESCLREPEEFSRQRPQHTAREWGRACCVQGTANRPMQLQRGELEMAKNEVEFTED